MTVSKTKHTRPPKPFCFPPPSFLFLSSDLLYICLPFLPIEWLNSTIRRHPSIKTPCIHTHSLGMRPWVIKGLDPTKFTKEVLGYVCVELVLCQGFFTSGGELEGLSSICCCGWGRDDEMEVAEHGAAGAIAFQKGLVYGDLAGETHTLAVATAVEGLGCSLWWWWSWC